MGRTKVAGRGDRCYSCCWGHGSREEELCKREREREREREVVGHLLVVDILVVNMAVRVVVAEGMADKEKEETSGKKEKNKGGWLVFCQL